MTAGSDVGLTPESGSSTLDGVEEPWWKSTDRYQRLALWVFLAGWLTAIPVILHLNRRQWFFYDEWAPLAGRSLTDPLDLLDPHNEHWFTIPIVLYRLVFHAVGLRHYWPYLVLAIVAHLAAAALLRVIMRRSGVQPLLATVGALGFTFFGPGRENFGWGFQVGFSGALALGLAYMVLADRDGPLGRRDLAAIGFGLASIMTAGVGVFMVVGVGVAVLLRRGWRVALAHTVPLGSIYLVWMILFPADKVAPGASVGVTARFSWSVLNSTVAGIGHWWPLGLLIVGVGVVGWLGAVATDPELVRGPWASLIGLVVAALLFIVVTSHGRAGLAELLGLDAGVPSRYVHITGALLLPFVVAGLGRVGARHPAAFIGVAALLLVGLPANVARIEPEGDERFLSGDPASWSALAESAASGRFPEDHRPEPFTAEDVTVGWLANAWRDGEIPRVAVTPAHRLYAETAMSVAMVQNPGNPPACESVTGVEADLRPGEILQTGSSRVMVTRLVDGKPSGGVGYWTPDVPVSVESTVAPLRVSVASLTDEPVSLAVCR